MTLKDIIYAIQVSFVESLNRPVLSKSGKEVELIDQLEDVKSSNPEKEYLKKEWKEKIWNTVSSLPEIQKRIIYLTFFEGYEDSEISSLLNKSTPSIRRNRGLAYNYLYNELHMFA